MNAVVFMTDEQRVTADRLGRLRCGAKPASFRNNDSGFHKNAPDRAYPHIVGAAVEIAYSALTGKMLDWRLFIGGDSSDFDGVEVKATTHTDPPHVLAIKQDEYSRKPKTKAYVLAIVDKEILVVRFLGSITREEFEKKKAEQGGKYKLNWAVSPAHLAPGLAVFENGRLRLIPFDRSNAVA